MGRGYGVQCPECSSPCEIQKAEVVAGDTVVPMTIFFCVSCESNYRWKSRVCPQCGGIMMESQREMEEPLYHEHGLLCGKCGNFWNDKRNLIKIDVEEVVENATKSY